MALYNRIVSNLSFRQWVSISVLVTLLATILLLTPNLALADSNYPVRPGDTLSKIAKNNNTTIEALVAANKTQYPCLAKTPTCLQVGWVITIPGVGGASTGATGPSAYTVQSGDSLSKIAKKLGVDFNGLIAANKKDRPCLAATTPCELQIGWVLNVPGGSGNAVVVANDNPAAVYVEYIAALNAYDIARFRATLHPEILGFNDPDVDTFFQFFFALLKDTQIKYEIVDLNVIERSGDTAKVAYTLRARSSLPDSSTVTSTASGVVIMKKYQGQWRFFLDEFSKLEIIR